MTPKIESFATADDLVGIAIHHPARGDRPELTPAEARAFAHDLLATADYIERTATRPTRPTAAQMQTGRVG